MSIQRRLALSITLVLLLSLTLGAALTYWHVVAKVRTEMQAALAVGTQTAAKAVDGRDGTDAPARRLRRLVEDFDGDRHIMAVLTAPDGHILAQSTLLQPDEPAPAWFLTMVAGPATRVDLRLAAPFDAVGALRLEADPHNEVAEAWSDVLLTATIMVLFFSMVLALAFWTIRGALQPLRDVLTALSRIGEGDYATRLSPTMYRELQPLRDGFDTMAERLAAMRAQNRDLHEQILNLQEEERAELARDLHDDVAPFLFSVGADAAMIRQYLAAERILEVAPRADAIAESVRHMQKHLKGVLRRLAPETLIDLGLAGAIDNLVAFWRLRRPAITFTMDLTDDPVDPPLDAVAFRVVQESLSNAIRHADPTTIAVCIVQSETMLTIRIEDDGTGFAPGQTPLGFGLASMQERVKAVGGRLAIRDRPEGHGVIIEAALPIRIDRDDTMQGDRASDAKVADFCGRSDAPPL
ncbi:sensor histidine kinase [Beijerinckia sp. L45]|uniref:sensor histidine kinase n=1 Tax=Beijerinckia sp. L45 TaxID=1641855 RepID=UPI00131E52F4|nr:sensor histidine kinase [Beijerinckia sp. L45]